MIYLGKRASRISPRWVPVCLLWTREQRRAEGHPGRFEDGSLVEPPKLSPAVSKVEADARARAAKVGETHNVVIRYLRNMKFNGLPKRKAART